MWICVTKVFMVYNSSYFVQTGLSCRSDDYTFSCIILCPSSVWFSNYRHMQMWQRTVIFFLATLILFLCPVLDTVSCYSFILIGWTV